MQNKLEHVMASLDVIQHSVHEETTFIVTDREKILTHIPASFTPPMPSGLPIETIMTPSLSACLEQGTVTKAIIGAEFTGVPMISIHCPIIQDGQVLGVLITSTTTEKANMLQSTSSSLVTTVGQMSATSDSIYRATESITLQLQEMAMKSNDIQQGLSEINNSVSLVGEIASQSHLLGLNAAIESARAGEYGAGFGVVAQEMRKLAEMTRTTAQKITEDIERINRSVKQNIASVNHIASITEEHLANTEELNASFHFITRKAEELQANATQLTGLK